jgi:hypothetical protein
MPLITVIVTKETQVQCGRELRSQDPIIKAQRGRDFSIAIVLKDISAMKRIRDHLSQLIIEEEAKVVEKELDD